ncbi:hypothetical protein SAMN04487948_102571 [Halogranum amylolyticum]|uniref:Peptidoglycan/xylan/chitin deacetylase, PgdA/CDA1 family n=1 Tax=Halogranum amylolyticum TaxID=660520 RepID=A0A1H8PYF1_9EURY|nr:hypothetical protein [Halogranum amylolyticum]SEO47019.1 hypothetical protein SAMN04487948_102571 [Halogranum amylolyticum]
MLTRRSAMKAGAAVATLSALPPSIRALSTDEASGSCVFIYDDGHDTDLTKTLPVHRELDAPACLATVSGYLSPTGDYLSEDDIQEFLDADWEILSHTDYHRPVGQIPLTDDVEEGDTKLEVRSSFHGRIGGDPLEVVDDDGNAIRVVVDDRDDGVITLEEPAPGPVSASADGRVRFPAEFTREKLRESKEELREIGGQARGFVAPFGVYDEWAAQLVAEEFEACGNGRFGNGINEDVRPYWMRRIQYEEMSFEELDELAAEAAERNAILVLGSHSWDENLTESDIENAVEAARDNGLAIRTLHDALVAAGAVEDSSEEDDESEETPTETPEETPTETPEETPTETPEETPTETPEETPTETPEETPTETPEETPTETPEETPTETPEETPTETPEETPTETPEETPTETPEETPTETPEETPTETPEETPTETPEEDDSSSEPPDESGEDDEPEETPTQTPTATPEPPSTAPPAPSDADDSSPPPDSSERSEPPDAPKPEETATPTPTTTVTPTPSPKPSSAETPPPETATPTATPTSTEGSSDTGSEATPAGTPKPTTTSRRPNSSGRIPLLSDLFDWLAKLLSL